MSTPVGSKPIDLPDSEVNELHTLYREGATDEPDVMLDRRILDAALSELLVDQARKAKHTTPWWKTWARPTSVVAVMILGLSVTWNVMDEQERAVRDEISSADSLHEPTGPAKTDIVSSQSAAAMQAPKDQAAVAEKKQVVAPPTATVAEPQAFPARLDQAASEARSVGSIVQPAAVADAPAEVRLRASVAPPAAPPPGMAAPVPASALAMPRAEAMSDQAAKSAAKRMASPTLNKEADATDDAATHEAWLDQIRKLRAAGRTAEAAESLERFRKRYPGVALPDDLLGVGSR